MFRSPEGPALKFRPPGLPAGMRQVVLARKGPGRLGIDARSHSSARRETLRRNASKSRRSTQTEEGKKGQAGVAFFELVSLGVSL